MSRVSSASFLSSSAKKIQKKVYKQCMEILLEVENKLAKQKNRNVDTILEMKEEQLEEIMKKRYHDYSYRFKQSNETDKLMSYHDFIVTNAIRSKSQFVFQYQKLALLILMSDRDHDNEDDSDHQLNGHSHSHSHSHIHTNGHPNTNINTNPNAHANGHPNAYVNTNANSNTNGNNNSKNEEQTDGSSFPNRKSAYILYPAFKHWAPKMAPLATVTNVKRIFNALKKLPKKENTASSMARLPLDMDMPDKSTHNEKDKEHPLEKLEKEVEKEKRLPILERFKTMKNSVKSASGNNIPTSNNSNSNNNNSSATSSSLLLLSSHEGEGKDHEKVGSGSSSKVSHSSSREGIDDDYVEGYIPMDRFLEYVAKLKECFELELKEGVNVRSTVGSNVITSHERLLLLQKGVTDRSGVVPRTGFVALTDRQLVYYGWSVTSKTIACKLEDVASIETTKGGGFFQRDSAIRVKHKDEEYLWNVVLLGSDARDRLYWSIKTMIDIVKEATKIKDNEKLKHFLLKESADDILRDNALHQIYVERLDRHTKASSEGKPLPKRSTEYQSVAFWRYASRSEKMDYIQRISQQLESFEKGWLSSVTGMFVSDNSDDQYRSTDLLSSNMEITADTYRHLKVSSRQQKRYEAIEEFEPKMFVTHIKAISTEIEPLEQFRDLIKCLIYWLNPGLTFVVVVTLLFIAYMNWVSNIPSFLLIMNSLFMVALKTDRDRVIQTFDNMLRYAGYEQLQLKEKQEKLRRKAYHQKKYFADPSIKEDIEKQLEKSNQSLDTDKDGVESSGIFAKIHKLKAGLEQTKIKLSEIQTKLGEWKVRLGKVRSIYKWNIEEQSKVVCAASCIIGLCLYFIPLRWMFVFAVCGVFWKHSPFNAKNKDKKSPMDIFLESIPADIPDVEEDDKEKEKEKEKDHDTNISSNNARPKPLQRLGEHLRYRTATSGPL